MDAIIIVATIGLSLFGVVWRICVCNERCDEDVIRERVRLAELALKEKQLLLGEGDAKDNS